MHNKNEVLTHTNTSNEERNSQNTEKSCKYQEIWAKNILEFFLEKKRFIIIWNFKYLNGDDGVSFNEIF